jgi:hypothetical protein
MSFPKTAKCEKCASPTVVLAWVPNAVTTIRPDDDVARTDSVTCRVECPNCGIRIQSVPYSFG